MGRNAGKPFALIQPVSRTKPKVPTEWIIAGREPSALEVRCLAIDLSLARAVAIDVETKGTRTWASEDDMVGLGVAWRDPIGRDRALYFDWASVPPERRASIWRVLHSIPEGTPVVAHNVYFDAGWCAERARRDGFLDAKASASPVRWTHCTYGLYRAFASEGWEAQQWGLKTAMEDCLGWTDTNERELHEWLLSRGIHKQGPKWARQPRRKEWASAPIDTRPSLRSGTPSALARPSSASRPPRGESPTEHLHSIMRWEAESPETREGKVRPDLSQMWRAPAAILGNYCCLDALATVSLFCDVLQPLLQRFPEFASFHTGAWMQVCLLLSEQTHFGIRVDRPAFEARIAELERQCTDAERRCREAPGLGEAIRALEEARLKEVVAELEAKEPPKHLDSDRPKEPKQRYKKDGSPTAHWVRWEKAMAEWQSSPPVSARWLAWRARMDDAPNRFKRWSPSSPDELRRVLFDSGLVKVHDDEEDPACFIVHGINGAVPLAKTEAGLFSTDAKLLSQLQPEIGEPLIAHADADTELSIARSYLEHLYWHADSQTWRLHAGWKVPGTKTGRLGGKEPNLQSVPKSIEFLDPLVPDEGQAWIEMDYSALEPHVLAELSRDSGLLALYGPDASPNHDRYLYSLARIAHPMFDKVRSLYDADNPTAEGVAAAKKECKRDRNFGKLLVLQSDYGAGARKKWQSALASGFRLTFEEMQEIHLLQRDSAPGVAQFKSDLEDEWRRRGGWVLSGLGFPTPVHEDYTRDLLNRVVQRTGHDCHTLGVWIWASLLEAEGIPFQGIVLDFHDQLIAQVSEDHAERACELVRRMLELLNELLGGIVKLKGEPQICRSMSAAKMSEDFEKREAERAFDRGGSDAA